MADTSNFAACSRLSAENVSKMVALLSIFITMARTFLHHIGAMLVCMVLKKYAIHSFVWPYMSAPKKPVHSSAKVLNSCKSGKLLC